MIRKIKYWLQLWDGVWSIPLSFLLFVLMGIVGETILGEGFAFYDPSILQAGLLASALIILFNMVAWLGIWFNFRGIFHYYLIYSKNDFKKLREWQRLLFLVFLYVFYFSVLTLLTIRLV